jgi:hypothetical protein
MTKGRLLIINVVLDLVILVTAALIYGCESDSAAQRIEIRPDSATLRYGESVTLTAYNGYIYTWSLQNNTWGTLDSRQGMMVTYTSICDPTAPQVQVITVTSTFTDNSGGSTGTTQTAQAYITHIPSTSDVGVAVSP